MVTAGVGTWDEVGRLTLPQLAAIGKYWEESPPAPVLIHMIAEMIAGKRISGRSEKQQSTAEELIAAFGPLPGKGLPDGR